jgi:uncharacterized iron-regulated membrane protein
MTLKKLYNLLHLWLGLATGLIFFIACLTGAALVFEVEAEEFFNPSFYKNTCKVLTGNRHSLDELYDVAKDTAGPYGLENITINRDSNNHNYIFETGEIEDKQLLIAINPFTKEIAGIRREDRRFFSIMEDLHRKLLMDKPGKFVTGACCLSYLVILITGVILWWPKNVKILKQRLKVKWDAKFKRLNWDLHSVFGFYALPFLFIMAFTGLTWSYDWFENGIYLVFDGKTPDEAKYKILTPQQENKIAGLLQNIVIQADDLLPYKGISEISLPGKKEVIRLEKRIPSWYYGSKDELVFDATTGTLIAAERWKDQSTGMNARGLMKPIHTGSIFGIVNKIAVFLACIIGVTLPVTGFIIWLGRKKKNVNQKPLPKKGSLVS